MRPTQPRAAAEARLRHISDMGAIANGLRRVREKLGRILSAAGTRSSIAAAARETGATLAAVRHATPVQEYRAIRLVPWDVLRGPFGMNVRRASDDYASIVHCLSSLNERTRASMTDVQPVANNLLEQVAVLSIALHDLSAEVPPEQRGQHAQRREMLSSEADRAVVTLQTLALDLQRLRSDQTLDSGIEQTVQEAREVLASIDRVLSTAETLRNTPD